MWFYRFLSYGNSIIEIVMIVNSSGKLWDGIFVESFFHEKIGIMKCVNCHSWSIIGFDQIDFL